MLVVSIISRTLYRRFSVSISLMSSKFLKRIAAGSNSASFNSLNGADLLCSVLCSSTSFKAMNLAANGSFGYPR
uniref:Uncharacterized protein n=1 Tax=Glossina palpalis gambiensis TaxID=67801 RepID=A0A1B0BP70_9MUSC